MAAGDGGGGTAGPVAAVLQGHLAVRVAGAPAPLVRLHQPGEHAAVLHGRHYGGSVGDHGDAAVGQVGQRLLRP